MVQCSLKYLVLTTRHSPGQRKQRDSLSREVPSMI